MSTDYSRPLRAAARAADLDEDQIEAHVARQVVHVSIDSRTPHAALVADVLVTNLRRLPIQLALDTATYPVSNGWLADLRNHCAGIDPARPLLVNDSKSTNGGQAPLQLHIGRTDNDADISAVPVGHGVRLRRRGSSFPATIETASALGAIYTAAVLSAEAFKTIVPVLDTKRRLLDRLDFCPVSLDEPSDSAMPVPSLTAAALVGCGAIGTAIVRIVQELGITGDLIAVDRETFDVPNLATYTLGGRAAAERKLPKVSIVAEALEQIAVHQIRGTVNDLITAIDAADIPMPTVVLSGVDNVEARHDIARLHADLVLDGSTGGHTGMGVSLAEAIPIGPCLRCYYPTLPSAAISTERRLADATGLPIERIAQGDDLTPEDLAGLGDEHRAMLEPHLGKPICALGRILGLTGTNSEFMPAAAFVAQQAAALVIGAWIRRSHEVTLAPRDVEYDALYGPAEGMIQRRRPRPDCTCQTDAALIAEVRHVRAHSSVRRPR